MPDQSYEDDHKEDNSDKVGFGFGPRVGDQKSYNMPAELDNISSVMQTFHNPTTPMKIVCCHTALNLIPPVSTIPGVQLYRVDYSNTAYHDTLAQIWREKERFINVEHDITVSEDRLKEIWDCNQPWCAIPFPYSPPHHDYLVDTGLGCAKFSEILMQLLPNLFLQSEALGDFVTYPSRHWKVVDIRLSLRLRDDRFHPHIHLPPVDHVHIQ